MLFGSNILAVTEILVGGGLKDLRLQVRGGFKIGNVQDSMNTILNCTDVIDSLDLSLKIVRGWQVNTLPFSKY